MVLSPVVWMPNNWSTIQGYYNSFTGTNIEIVEVCCERRTKRIEKRWINRERYREIE
jgi:hypothetical protein